MYDDNIVSNWACNKLVVMHYNINLFKQACKDGNIRLLEAGESLGILQGTIQMCYNNSYGTICSDGWDYNDAHVLCNQSNIPGNDEFNTVKWCKTIISLLIALRAGSVAPFSDAHFGAGFGNILFSNFSCNGSEKTLLSCPHSFIYQTPGCTHDNDAGVHCYCKVEMYNCAASYATFDYAYTGIKKFNFTFTYM